RATAVPKSAIAAPGKRPSVEDHVASFSVERDLDSPKRITLVDDVVTKGVTVLAAASVVKSVFPDTDVRAFAVVRTMGLVPEVDALVDPCTGRIWREHGVVKRDP